ncbi:MAG: DUF4835 domain-containing protein [Bacteroidetes bacterium 24-39-8]|jgi:hypothetical protein|nr:MAG: DUF4835 domain-containing protein [Sphingobacteriia bacterium 35-40-8]OYZ52705.1 MAG: DUF4835 domain-containing protein [Bacteroidetes bacterium 24-39-8]OZA68885.1 MAG: DUF4835 domain-containing protein [Sphingobacteriia bacterium 39-39-8]HQR92570.1 DUF4835 family protein [Sediminibacterium sp.]HQS54419.1 DUF4835 family protein [Sediminibacterium sp.]
MHKKLLILFVAFQMWVLAAVAQELNARVTVLSNRVGTTVDRKIFTSLQQQLTNLLNTRKWTNEIYKVQEKIDCSFIINIEQVVEANIYKATLTVQAARPIFNASYKSAIVNYQDADLTFKYIEFQPVEFNENRVQGNDASVANLTAVLAFYAYSIIGLDNDSFSPKAGESQFNKALNVVTNAPEGKNIAGWRIFDGLRNRYWLNENLTNNKYNIIHDVIYTYYRAGMDKLYDNEAEARGNILQALIQLQAFNKENPNTMILQFFMQGKYQELVGIFKKASATEKARAVEILSEIDIVNSSKYKQELQ